METRFHKYAEKRVVNLAQQRRNRGLDIDGENAEKIVKKARKKRPKPAEEESAGII